MSIQGTEITDQRSLNAVLAKMKIGDSVAIKLIRDAKEMELEGEARANGCPGLSWRERHLERALLRKWLTSRLKCRGAGLASKSTIRLSRSQGCCDQRDQKTLLFSCFRQTSKPGDTVKIKVLREGKELPLEARLQQRGQPNRQDQNSDGQRTKRKSEPDFQTYFQSDTIIKPKDCGGPICDLDGHVIGINIARAGRVEELFHPFHLRSPPCCRS